MDKMGVYPIVLGTKKGCVLLGSGHSAPRGLGTSKKRFSALAPPSKCVGRMPNPPFVYTWQQARLHHHCHFFRTLVPSLEVAVTDVGPFFAVPAIFYIHEVIILGREKGEPVGAPYSVNDPAAYARLSA